VERGSYPCGVRGRGLIANRARSGIIDRSLAERPEAPVSPWTLAKSISPSPPKKSLITLLLDLVKEVAVNAQVVLEVHQPLSTAPPVVLVFRPAFLAVFAFRLAQ
jgi:hypothetical protein